MSYGLVPLIDLDTDLTRRLLISCSVFDKDPSVLIAGDSVTSGVGSITSAASGEGVRGMQPIV